MRFRITRLLLLGLLVAAVAWLLLGTNDAPAPDRTARARPAEPRAVLVTPDAEGAVLRGDGTVFIASTGVAAPDASAA